MSSKVALFVIGALGILLGCEIAHDAMVCNGFQEPIIVVYINKSVPQHRKLSITPGTCTEPSHAASVMTDQDRSIARNLSEGISIVSAEGRTLARYALGGVYMQPTLHAATLWMLTKRGIFRVPMEFQNTWASNIEKIQKLSQPASPNLYEGKDTG